MSFDACPTCGGMLAAGAGSACLNMTCLNSERGRVLARASSVVPVDLSAALSMTPLGVEVTEAAARKAQTRAKRSASRQSKRPKRRR